jgi:uncharacterized protein (DUF433 family)
LLRVALEQAEAWQRLAALRAALRRVAPVIGNARYQKAPPPANPQKDATDVAAALRAAGFSGGREVSSMTDLLTRISIGPAVCGGKPCIRGTRIWVSLILDLPASGMSEAELRAESPALTHEDILAAIACGAEAARERSVPARAVANGSAPSTLSGRWAGAAT